MVGGLSNLVGRWVRQGVVVAALCLGASIAGAWLGWRLSPSEAAPTRVAATEGQHADDLAVARPPLLQPLPSVDHAAALLEQQLIERVPPIALVPVGERALALSVAEPPAAPPRLAQSSPAAPLAAPSAALPTTAAPPLGEGEQYEASLSFYYCGANGGPRVGDGGGFCGHMANGQVVHPGAAACAAPYMGQRFRVEGDPYGRVYTCTDTGGAVGGMHRDIWFDDAGVGWAWLQTVGFTATIEIVE